MRSLVIFLGLVSYVQSTKNNVCHTFIDYYEDLEKNDNCSFNPDVDLEVPSIITRNGYPVEIYNVTTDDGYFLTLFRIPSKRNGNGNSHSILLQHGMGLNSVVFVNRGNKSLGFLLADEGFDVWLGNFRGTQYSKGHVSLKTDSIAYWNFSFHELGIFDIPAQIATIKKVRKMEEKIIYLGFSMGTTAGYVYNTIYPEQASKNIQLFINLAPVAYLGNIRTVFKYFTFIWDFLQKFVEEESLRKELLKRDYLSVEITKRLCLPFPFQMKLCSLSTMLLSGFDVEQLDPETLPVTTVQNVDSTSAKILSHYVQGMKSHTFSHYDHGTKTNFVLYGSSLPPRYNLSVIKVPIYLFHGNNDWLASEEDVLKLYNELPNDVKYGIYKAKWDRFTHSDFLTAKDIKVLLYDKIIQVVNNFIHKK